MKTHQTNLDELCVRKLVHGFDLSPALSQYPAVLLQLSEPYLRLTDGGFLLLLNEELRGLLLFSQYFHQGRELDVDPSGGLLKSHLLVEDSQSYVCVLRNRSTL